MNSFRQLTDILMGFFDQVFHLIGSDATTVQGGVRYQMAQSGLSPFAQVGVILAVAFVLIIMSARLFGGIFRFAMIVAVLMFADRIVLPLISS